MPSSPALAMTSGVGLAAGREDHRGHAGMARDRYDVKVHLQGHQYPTGGCVGQHVGQQVGGVALGDVGVGGRAPLVEAPRRRA